MTDFPGIAEVTGACTLPTAEQPLRIAEWNEILATAVTEAHRSASLQATFRLQPGTAVAARVADLMVRETQCCSFFIFGLTASGSGLELTVTVPPTQAPVLDALVNQATAMAEGQR